MNWNATGISARTRTVGSMGLHHDGPERGIDYRNLDSSGLRNALA
jgi:hypothetical protein